MAKARGMLPRLIARAVPAVDESSGGQAENEVGECAGSPDKTGLGG